MTAATNQIIRSRYLAERSYLYFQYPQPSNERSIEFYLPMLENVEINESQRANLATYDLIGRAGNLYSYLGAKSREFTLRFNITLPNVLDYLTNVGLNQQFRNSFRYFYSERDNAKRAFKKYEQRKNSLDGLVGQKFNYYTKAKNRLTSFDKTLEAPKESDFLQNAFKFFTDLGLINPNYLNRNTDTMENAVNYLMTWVNIIRTSTVNHSKNTTLGCPMIYVNHGTMYNNIPCICNSYSINLENTAGYDLNSLTPRRLAITLNLSENRSGNFGNFVPFSFKESVDILQSENVAGWEAILEYGTMDPYNSTFGEDDLDAFQVTRIAQEEEEAEQSRKQAQEEEEAAKAREQVLGQRAGLLAAGLL